MLLLPPCIHFPLLKINDFLFVAGGVQTDLIVEQYTESIYEMVVPNMP
jgi:hypothetical protein